MKHFDLWEAACCLVFVAGLAVFGAVILLHPAAGPLVGR